MERELEIATADEVAIRYELAGLGSRFLAVFVDLILQTLAFVAVAVAFGFGNAGAVAIARVLHVSPALARALTIAFFTFVLFAIYFGYFIVAEWQFRGRTIGKRVVGIRVVRDGGYPIDLLASAIRNLVRVLEAALGFYFVSAIVALVSKENKRLGDYAAGTIVIRDVRFDPVALQAVVDAAPVTALDAATRALVERYLDRRTMLADSARARVAAQLAARIRPAFANDPALATLDDDAFLVRLATRTSA